MEINLDGSFDLKSGLEDSFSFLTNLQELSACVPDLKEVKLLDKHNLEAVLVIKIGPINGNFNATCDLESSRPDAINLKIDGSGGASALHLTILIKLEKKAEKITTVGWNAKATISGLVSGLGETILRKVSDSKIQDIINNLNARSG